MAGGQWPVCRGAAGIPDSGLAKRKANKEKADRFVSASPPAFLIWAISFISFVSLGGDAEAQSAVPRDDPSSKAAGPGLE